MHDSLATIEKCHERMLGHYQWAERVKGTSAVWPWEWPTVPPITPELLDAMDKAAQGLEQWVRDFTDASAHSSTSPGGVETTTNLPKDHEQEPSSEAAKETDFEFVRRAEMFSVRGLGESGNFPADLVGFQQIAMLLKKPGEGVPMIQLVACGKSYDNRVKFDKRRSEQPGV